MTSLRRFAAHDLFNYNNVNLDYFTETVGGAAQQLSAALQGRPRPQPAARRSPLSPSRRRRLPAAPLQYNLSFYLQYLAKWPEYCVIAEGPGRQAMGYSKLAGRGCAYSVLRCEKKRSQHMQSSGRRQHCGISAANAQEQAVVGAVAKGIILHTPRCPPGPQSWARWRARARAGTAT